MDEEDFACIKEVEKVVHISLPLSYAGNQISGVFDRFESWKSHYLSLVEGIVIGYKNVSFVDPMGKIMADQPFIHFDVKATFDVFRPSLGSTLKGKVNRISKQHIGCLVHDSINASIFLSDDFADNIYEYVAVDKEIIFDVTRVDVQRKVIRIEGEISPKCFELMKRLFPQVRALNTHKFFDESEGESTVPSEIEGSGREDHVIKKEKQANININDSLSNNILSFLNQTVTDLKNVKSKKGKKRKRTGSDIDISDSYSECSTVRNAESDVSADVSMEYDIIAGISDDNSDTLSQCSTVFNAPLLDTEEHSFFESRTPKRTKKGKHNAKSDKIKLKKMKEGKIKIKKEKLDDVIVEKMRDKKEKKKH